MRRDRPYGAALVVALSGSAMLLYATTGLRTDGQLAAGLVLGGAAVAAALLLLLERPRPAADLELDRRRARDPYTTAELRHPTRSARWLRLAVEGDPDAIRRELDLHDRPLGPLERRRT